MILFECPNCQAHLRAAEEDAGSHVVCRGCGSLLIIPAAVPPIGSGEVPSLESAAAEGAVTAPAMSPANPSLPFSPGQAWGSVNGDGAPSAYDQPMDAVVLETPADSAWPLVRPGRPFGILTTFLGLPAAVLFCLGVFLPLFEVQGRSLLPQDWRLWLVQSGGVLLGLVACGLIVTRRYAGLWVLGPGSLLALLLAFFLLFARIAEEHGVEKAMLLRPGTGLLLLFGASLLLTVAVLLRPRPRRYEYPGS